MQNDDVWGAEKLSWLLLQESLVTGSFDLQDILFYGGCGFSIMRCMSFALENCEKKEGNYTFTDLLKYNFYLPFFFFGPIMTFDRYHAQVRILDSAESGGCYDWRKNE